MPVAISDRDHPTRGIDVVEALDAIGPALECWRLDDAWAGTHEHNADQLSHAVLRGDDAHIAALTAPDWTRTTILRDLVDDLGDDVTITTWPLNNAAEAVVGLIRRRSGIQSKAARICCCTPGGWR